MVPLLLLLLLLLASLPHHCASEGVVSRDLWYILRMQNRTAGLLHTYTTTTSDGGGGTAAAGLQTLITTREEMEVTIQRGEDQVKNVFSTTVVEEAGTGRIVKAGYIQLMAEDAVEMLYEISDDHITVTSVQGGKTRVSTAPPLPAQGGCIGRAKARELFAAKARAGASSYRYVTMKPEMGATLVNVTSTRRPRKGAAGASAAGASAAATTRATTATASAGADQGVLLVVGEGGAPMEVPVTSWETVMSGMPMKVVEQTSVHGDIMQMTIESGAGQIEATVTTKERALAAAADSKSAPPEMVDSTHVVLSRAVPDLHSWHGRTWVRMAVSTLDGSPLVLPQAGYQRVVEQGKGRAGGGAGGGGGGEGGGRGGGKGDAVGAVDRAANSEAEEGSVVGGSESDSTSSSSATSSLTVLLDLSRAPVRASSEDLSDRSYRDPSAMVDSADPRVRELAESAVGALFGDANAGDNAGDGGGVGGGVGSVGAVGGGVGAGKAGGGSDVRSEAEVMGRARKLRAAVKAHIRTFDLATGFASASETARRRAGDCSEHAVLLAAVLRADGIPSRLCSGVVYTEKYVTAAEAEAEKRMMVEKARRMKATASTAIEEETEKTPPERRACVPGDSACDEELARTHGGGGEGGGGGGGGKQTHVVRGSFAWHAWTQALVHGRWVDLDATLHRVSYSVGHLLMGTASMSDATGHADDMRFAALVGNLRIEVEGVGGAGGGRGV